MIKKFNNLFEVKANDTLGTAVLKGATKGYLQGVIVSGLGLGVLGITFKVLADKGYSKEEEEELEESVKEVEDLDDPIYLHTN